MTATEYGEFQVANEFLDDIETLNSVFDRQGYLMFRGVLDTDEVLQVKSDLVQEFQRQGFVKNGGTDSVWTGKSLDELDDERVYGLEYFSKLIDTDTTQAFFEKVFGASIFTFRSCSVRYTLPQDKRHGSPAHQDHVYIKHNKEFRTMWIPLMDIDRTIGGLALGEGSHERGLREHEEQDVYSYVIRGRKQIGISPEAIDKPWLTTEFHPGDVVVFHPHTIHWGLPNTSNMVRLSVDVRCQPASLPRPWMVQASLAEMRQLRTDAQKIAAEEGASQELFEAVIIEMMGRGLKAGRAEVRGLMAELSGESR